MEEIKRGLGNQKVFLTAPRETLRTLRKLLLILYDIPAQNVYVSFDNRSKAIKSALEKYRTDLILLGMRLTPTGYKKLIDIQREREEKLDLEATPIIIICTQGHFWESLEDKDNHVYVVGTPLMLSEIQGVLKDIVIYPKKKRN
jgi:hypothetical protein